MNRTLPWWLPLAILTAPASAQTTLPGSAPAAENLLAGCTWQYSTDGGKNWSQDPPVVSEGGAAVVEARTRFKAADPSAWAVLEFTHGLPRYDAMELAFNGQATPAGLTGMIYRTIPAIPANLLKKGDNELALKITYLKQPPPEPDKPAPDVTVKLQAALVGLSPRQLAFVFGPVLGAAGADFFTVTCRTNMPVAVSLKVSPADGAGQPIVKRSEPGLYHRFRVDGLAAKLKWQYALSVEDGPYKLTGKSYPVRLMPQGDALRFIVFGDCRTRTNSWASVAEAVSRAKPDFLVFTGDMTECGRFDWLWQEHFFASAAELLATVPFYAVIGNHEEDAAVYPRLFYTPGGDGLSKDWAQRIGPVLIVGFDGMWSQTWERAKRPWLRKAMDEPEAKFIFVATHYPAYSSAKNGELDPKTNLPKHWAYRNGREFVVPLLARQHAAAMIVAHEHMYERSELPGDVTQIISGGAGAPNSKRTPEATAQNPYAKVYDPALHYCLFEVKGDECTFRALTPAGKEIDTRTWKARPKE